MLSPVTAVSTADFSFSNVSARPEAIGTTPAVPSIPQVTQDTSASSPAAVARALSGELQIHQSGTILAETLGKLLNIARMDGETAEAYVNRLVISVQALPADQLASLEKQLGALLKDMTVAVLLDALKNATGPDAARLAALFEIARSGQAGEGARPTLPAYLQDILPDEPVLSIRPAAVQLQQSVPMANNVAAATIQLPEQLQDAIHASQGKPAPMQMQGEAAKLPTQPFPDVPQPDAVSLNITKPQVARDIAQAAASAEKGPETAATTADLTQPKRPNISAPLPTATIMMAAKTAEVFQAGIVPFPEIEGGNPVTEKAIAAAVPSLVASTMLTVEQFRTATPQDMEKLLLAVLLGKLPQSAEPPATSDALLDQIPPPTAEAERETKQRFPSHAPAPASPGSPQVDKAETAAALRQDMHLAAKAATMADARMAILDQPLLQSAAAALITKEATPLPFVNYPIEKEEEDSESPPRGRWPSSEGEAGGEQGFSGEEQPEDGGQGDERVAASDGAVDQSLSDGAHEDGRVGEAESYYLRMSNFA